MVFYYFYNIRRGEDRMRFGIWNDICLVFIWKSFSRFPCGDLVVKNISPGSSRKATTGTQKVIKVGESGPGCYCYCLLAVDVGLLWRSSSEWFWLWGRIALRCIVPCLRGVFFLLCFQGHGCRFPRSKFLFSAQAKTMERNNTATFSFQIVAFVLCYIW